MTLLEKVGLWGSIASIIGLIATFAFAFLSAASTNTQHNQVASAIQNKSSNVSIIHGNNNTINQNSETWVNKHRDSLRRMYFLLFFIFTAFLFMWMSLRNRRLSNEQNAKVAANQNSNVAIIQGDGNTVNQGIDKTGLDELARNFAAHLIAKQIVSFVGFTRSPLSTSQDLETMSAALDQALKEDRAASYAALSNDSEAKNPQEIISLLKRQAEKSRLAEKGFAADVAQRQKVIGIFQVYAGDFPGAKESFLNAAQSNPMDNDIIGRLGYVYFILGKLDDAEINLQSALASATDTITKAYGEMHLAHVYRSRQKLDLCIPLYASAAKKFRKAKDMNGLSPALAALGASLIATGDKRRGMANINESLEIAENTSNLVIQFGSLFSLATAYLEQKDTKHAEPLLVKARSIENQRSITGQQCILDSGFAYLMRCKGELDEAEMYSRRSISQAELLNFKEYIWVGKSQLWRILSEKGDTAGAFKVAKEAVKAAKETGDLRKEAEALEDYAMASFGIEDMDFVSDILRKAIVLYCTIGDSNKVQELKALW